MPYLSSRVRYSLYAFVIEHMPACGRGLEEGDHVETEIASRLRGSGYDDQFNCRHRLGDLSAIAPAAASLDVLARNLREVVPAGTLGIGPTVALN